MIRAILTACRRSSARFVEQDGIEPVGRVAGSGEAAHPDPVGDEEMVERPEHRAEEDAAAGAQLIVGEVGRSKVEPFVAPAIVAGQQASGAVESMAYLRDLMAKTRPPRRDPSRTAWQGDGRGRPPEPDGSAAMPCSGQDVSAIGPHFPDPIEKD